MNATAGPEIQSNRNPKDLNAIMRDPALLPLVDRYLNEEDKQLLLPLMQDLSDEIIEELSDLADVADKNPPILEQFDREGNRVDNIVYHESYRKLVEAGFETYGISALSHKPIHGWGSIPPHLVKYLISYLFMQAEYGLGCPINMTDAAARTLRKFGAPRLFTPFIDRLTSTEPGHRYTGAMFMTETQAGTDIAKTETTAKQDEEDRDVWYLTGDKWFASNPDADVVLTLARFPGGEEHSTRGVGLFMLPKQLPDGTKNSYFIRRLKEKFGTRSMPSGEVRLDRAYALQVGQLGRGFRQMAEMINSSRLSNAMRSAALMRRATVEAIEHARGREIFGKNLIDQPLMRATLMPLQIEAEGALGMIFFAGQQLEDSDHGDENSAQLIRVLTPIAKHYICKRARWVTGESMEVRGGTGYIEDFPNSRLVRDAHLGSIWEGASNVIALDVLRCMQKFGSHEVLAAAMQEKLTKHMVGDAAPGVQELQAIWHELFESGNRILAIGGDYAQAIIGQYTDRLCKAIEATLLIEQASHEINTTGSYRTLLVANTFIRSRVLNQEHASAEIIEHLEDVVNGSHLDRNAALQVFKSGGH